jgi:hypothetical protein
MRMLETVGRCPLFPRYTVQCVKQIFEARILCERPTVADRYSLCADSYIISITMRIRIQLTIHCESGSTLA